ncbi:unnamed protein product, partial [Heterotrigona itama]
MNSQTKPRRGAAVQEHTLPTKKEDRGHRGGMKVGSERAGWREAERLVDWKKQVIIEKLIGEIGILRREQVLFRKMGRLKEAVIERLI